MEAVAAAGDGEAVRAARPQAAAQEDAREKEGDGMGMAALVGGGTEPAKEGLKYLGLGGGVGEGGPALLQAGSQSGPLEGLLRLGGFFFFIFFKN